MSFVSQDWMVDNFTVSNSEHVLRFAFEQDTSVHPVSFRKRRGTVVVVRNAAFISGIAAVAVRPQGYQPNPTRRRVSVPNF